MGYHAVAMHMFGVWFCWFVDFSLVQCAAVLNVSAGAEACCLAIGHHGRQVNTKNGCMEGTMNISQFL
jgi:hypothetical protein